MKKILISLLLLSGQLFASNLIQGISTGAGSGNVTGPNSSTAHSLAGFSNTTGQLLEDSGIAESAVATLTGSQTLTNKTLTSPIITTPTGFIEVFTGHLETPTNKTYIIDESAAYAYTINTLKIISASGTVTAAININGTPVTGISAVSVSSSIATGTATAANSVSVGNLVTLVLSSNSTALDVGYTLKVTR